MSLGEVGATVRHRIADDPDRQARRSPAGSDLALAGTLAAVGAALTVAVASAQNVDSLVVPAAFVVMEIAPLAWRRRAPVVVLGVTVAVFAVGAWVTAIAHTPLLGPLVAAYTVGSRCRRGVAATAAVAAGLGMPLVGVGLLGTPFPLTFSVTPPPELLLDAVIGSVLGIGGAALLGAYVGTRRAYVAELADRARRLEREREERAERAVSEERARIARELHDLAAHHLYGIALQASALTRTLDRDPAQARSLVDDIRASSSTALTAMRRMVSLLRADDTDGLAPQPSLDDIPQLVERARVEGTDVALETADPDRSLPREVGLAAYRIVQESLTNARRHAPGAAVIVRLHPTDDALRVEVADDGPAAGDTAVDDGYGLIGMRERVSLLGGELVAGPRHDGHGWRVCAVLPTDQEDGR